MATYRSVMDVNFFGLVAVTKALLPAVRRRRGRVVNVASMFGRVGGPSVSAYCASKYAVEAFSDALRREMWPFGVHVAIVEPGFAKTPINHDNFAKIRAAFHAAPASVRDAYGDAFLATSGDAVADVMKNALEPDVIVDAMAHAVEALTPKTRYLVGTDAWVFTLVNMLPTFMGDWLLATTSPLWRLLPAQTIFR